MEGDAVGLLRQEFSRIHGDLLRVYRAPGRVNLIGEHIDYNDGFVMPAAIGMASYVAMSRRPDARIHAHSANYNESVEIDLHQLGKGHTGHWSDYVRGVAGSLQADGIDVQGANLLIQGSVPVGSGLSSSAALEVSVCMALLAASHEELDLLQIAQICQRAEHEFVGTKCGIMDQFSSCFGEKGRALLLDCRSLTHDVLPIPPAGKIVVCNTKVTHKLGTGEYNKRRADCEEAVTLLKAYMPHIQALRDVNIMELQQRASALPAQVFRRARHVVTEIGRTQAAARALKVGDLDAFGQLMYDSHRSLREDYEVSCFELDVMVELAQQCAGVYGARMTGGGFGGCVVAMVESGAVNDFQARIEAGYKQKTGIDPEIYVCEPAEGAGEV